jgi:hypothetical protein
MTDRRLAVLVGVGDVPKHRQGVPFAVLRGCVVRLCGFDCRKGLLAHPADYTGLPFGAIGQNRELRPGTGRPAGSNH